MISAARVSNFIPQNPALTAPRRISVSYPTFEGASPEVPFGFPSAKDVDGGIKYSTNDYNLVTAAGRQNPYEQSYPCLISPALKTNVHIAPPAIDDTNGFVPAYGQLRTNPEYIAGIATTEKRAALLRKPVNPNVAVNSLIGPMMKTPKV